MRSRRTPASTAFSAHSLSSRFTHDLSSGPYRRAGNIRFVGVDREHRCGMFLLQLRDHGQDTFQFLFGANGERAYPEVRTRIWLPCGWLRNTGSDPRSGTCRFATNVHDVRSFVQQSRGVSNSLVSIQELATVGKRIWSDVDDAHDQRALAQFQRAPSQIPLEDRSHAARF